MTKYIANPIEVNALKITDVSAKDAQGNITIELEDGSKKLLTMGMGMLYKLFPLVGDYFVTTTVPDVSEYVVKKVEFEAEYGRSDGRQHGERVKQSAPNPVSVYDADKIKATAAQPQEKKAATDVSKS